MLCMLARFIKVIFMRKYYEFHAYCVISCIAGKLGLENENVWRIYSF